MAYSVPDLTYPFDALEPHIDARTMEIHHGKHHAAYVNNLNAAVKDHTEVARMPLEQILAKLGEMPEAVRIVGWAHGILFIGFVLALMLARDTMRWSFRWTGLVLLAALLPFGPFVIDSRLRKEDEGCGRLSRQSI